MLPPGSVSAAVTREVERSHRYVVPLALPVARVLPSGLNAAEYVYPPAGLLPPCVSERH
jgi:hypothetical protein